MVVKYPIAKGITSQLDKLQGFSYFLIFFMVHWSVGKIELGSIVKQGGKVIESRGKE